MRTGNRLTAWNHNPYEVQEKVVAPKIIRLGPAICKSLMVMIKHARGVIENVAIYLTQRDHGLKRVTQRVFIRDENSDYEREWAPENLSN